jgi:hypothetical protein
MDEKFTIIVEGNKSNDPITPQHDLELNGLTWPGENPPDIVVMPGGLMLALIGLYSETKEQYQYRIADVAHLIGGRLESKP